MTLWQELERELETLKNNGLIHDYQVLSDHDTSFEVSIRMHDKRDDAESAQ